MSTKSHYYLTAGEIIIGHKANPDAPVATISNVRLNALVRTQEAGINAPLMGKAQQALQLQFFKNEELSPDMEVVDVVLLSFIYCGYQTEEEFQGKAE